MMRDVPPPSDNPHTSASDKGTRPRQVMAIYPRPGTCSTGNPHSHDGVGPGKRLDEHDRESQ